MESVTVKEEPVDSCEPQNQCIISHQPMSEASTSGAFGIDRKMESTMKSVTVKEEPVDTNEPQDRCIICQQSISEASTSGTKRETCSEACAEIRLTALLEEEQMLKPCYVRLARLSGATIKIEDEPGVKSPSPWKFKEEDNSFEIFESSILTKIKEELENTRKKDYFCKKCNYNGSTEKELETHLASFHKKPATASVGSAVSNAILVISKLKNHKSKNSFKCDHCFKQFKLKINLDTHVKIHYGGKPFVCKLCGKRYTYSGDLTRHLKLHNGVKPFECDVCHKTFSRKSDVARHSRIHTDERRYECVICGYRFLRNEHLLSHSRLHTINRPLECDICKKTFNYKTSLVRHIKTHNTVKSFKCNLCGKGFTDKSNLSGHLVFHGERQFRCHPCGRMFHLKKDLKKHLLKLHDFGKFLKTSRIRGVMKK